MRSQSVSAAVLLALLALPVSAAITGTVMTADGQPLAGARVTLHVLQSPEARREQLLSATPLRVPLSAADTDARGNFSLPSPKEPVVDLRIDLRGYAPEVRRVEREEEAGAIALAKRDMKSGLITAAGKPVSGATVVISYGGVDYTVVTDDKGRYEAPDTKRIAGIAVIHPDHAIDEERFMNPNTPVSELNRTLVAGTPLSGHTVAADGKSPVAKATIALDGWPLASSGDDGSFTIAHMPARWGSLTATKEQLLGTRAFPAAKNLSIRMEKAATVSGRVLDAKTKVPVPGVTLQLFVPRRAMAGESAPSAITDAKGAYTIVAAPGSYMFIASHPAYDASPADVSLTPGQQAVKDLTLTQLARVSGNVVDEDKRPVVASTVAVVEEPFNGMPPMRMMRGTESGTVSGPDGRFSLRVSGDSDLRLRAVKKGLPAARSETIHVAAGERKGGVVLTIPTGVAVTGHVKDAHGDPLPGVAVSATETPTGGNGMMFRRMVMSGFLDQGEEDVVRTAADGSFTIRVKEGTYDFSFKREGYAPKDVRAQNITPAGGVTIETTLDPAVEIAGRITRGGTGVPDVSISALGLDLNATSGPDGSFTLSGLTPGSVRLFLRKENDLVQEMRTFTAPARDVVIELPVGGTVRGRVVEKGTRKPVTSFTAGVSTSSSGGGMVRMSPPMLRSFTSDDGSFTLEHVPTGAMTVVASAPGFAAARTSVDVQEGKTAPDVVVELEAGVRLIGRVTTANGSPVSDASVMIQPSPTGSFAVSGSLRRTNTDTNGEYSLDSLDAGEETISVNHPQYNSASKSVTLKGRETRLDIQLEGGQRVTGTVVSESGMPLADAEVTAFSAGASRRSARTNVSGTFELESMPPAHYRFTASKSGYADAVLNDVDISSGSPIRMIMGAGGTIYGQVSGLPESDYANTTVQAFSGRISASASVDPTGNYRIEGAPVGTVQVSAMVRSASFDYRSSTPETVELTAGGSQQVNFEFRGDTVLQGHITRNGIAAGGVMVSFQSLGGGRANASVTADDQGAYRVSGLDSGDYRVMVNDIQRGGSYTTSYTVHGSTTFDIDYKAGSVRGRVIDATTNEPVADVNIQVRPTAGEVRMVRGAVSDPSGAFSIDMVPAGAYSINASRKGFASQVLDLTIGDTGREGLELKLVREEGMTLRVVDGRDGRTLTASVTVFDAQGRVVHDTRTSFRSPDQSDIAVPVPAGTYTATVFAPFYAPRSVSFTAPSTQTVTMTPGGTILIQSKHSERRGIRLLDSAGMIYPRTGQPSPPRDLLPGTLPLDSVAPGSYTLQLLDDAGALLATQPVVVREGETVRVEI
ncbi:MAG: carboxypeptidase regulatory-like domain-containing protein [Acidobacteriota bacterium]